MDNLDKRLAAALAAAENETDTREPGFYALAFGTMRGRNGWVAMVLMAVQTVMFGLSVWAGWHFWAATEVLPALKWGLSAAVLFLCAVQLKMALVPQMQADRVIHALRRLEARLARHG